MKLFAKMSSIERKKPDTHPSITGHQALWKRADWALLTLKQHILSAQLLDLLTFPEAVGGGAAGKQAIQNYSGLITEARLRTACWD